MRVVLGVAAAAVATGLCVAVRVVTMTTILLTTSVNDDEDDRPLPTSSSSCQERLRRRPPLSTTDARRALRRAYYDVVPSRVRGVEHILIHLLGRALLDEATRRDRTLVTLQMGGMDGRSNDPLWTTFVGDGHKGKTNKQNATPNLTHWMPVVVEPVERNFQALQRNYASVPDLRCFHAVRWAMKYDAREDQTEDEASTDAKDYNENNNGTCTFYTFDDSETAPRLCKDKP